jgi:hypothetical protein
MNTSLQGIRARRLGQIVIPFFSSSAAGSVGLMNLTRPGAANFAVGESFSLQITGAAPNTPVYAIGRQNGDSNSIKAPMGPTDATGAWSTSGAMGQNTLGSWRELWYVGEQQVADISFQVYATPPATPAPAPVATDVTPAPADTTETAAGQPSEIVGSPVVDQVISTLPAAVQPAAKAVQAAANTMPTWAWGLLVGLGLCAFSGGRKR